MPGQDNRFAELVAELSRVTGLLIRKEVELATTEMTMKARQAGGHVGTAAVGGAMVHVGLLVLIATIVIGLAQLGVAPWLSSAIIGIGTVAMGYVLMNQGTTALRATSFVPTRPVHAAKQDMWTRNRRAGDIKA